MQANTVVIQNILLCLTSVLMVSPLHPFPLQSVKETLRDGVIPTISLATHAAFNFMGTQQFPEAFARTLGSAIRVVYQAPGRPTLPNRHAQCITDESRLHA